MFSCLNKLSERNQYLIKTIIFNFFGLGLAAILIGSFLPDMREAYGLDYAFSGVLVSVYNAGNILIGLVTALLAIAFGRKRCYLVMTMMASAGFLLMLLTHNPLLLLVAFAAAGIARGAGVNYGNGVVTELSRENASLLNMANALFALGALIAPFLLLGFNLLWKNGWKIALVLIVVLGLISAFTMTRMHLEDAPSESGKKIDFGFFKSKLFWLTVVFSFCYMSTEASVTGWMVSFFSESGTVNDSFSLVLNGVLWTSILLGRFLCSALSEKLDAPKMLTLLSVGMLIFFACLMISHSLVFMLLCTIGFGLSVSGMYATALANVGEVCRKYPFALGFYTTLAGIGGIVTPSIIGGLADAYGLRMGMLLLFVPLLLQLVFVLINLARVGHVSFGFGQHKRKRLAKQL